ncbi:DUF1641 domain-containing protein [Pseudobacillus badius]|uniref:DUF1641 domain-containing protein n=1 Tax=Bacillus badius TaxID=1455 RepID=UPI0007B3CF51|nr:DUF1641 domain-containing protein [Bacillus badius]KZR59701.1 hypothetical protein A3781_11625 [Bacillus badius]
MAKAVRQISRSLPNEQEEQSQAAAAIMKELADNQEAIISMIAIVKNLHEMGVLNMIKGLLEQRTDVGAIAIQQMNQPGMHNVIKNGMNEVKFLGAINPEQLANTLDGVNYGLQRASKSLENNEEPSMWQLGKSMRTPEARASLAVMTEFLQGMGQSFHQDKKESQ